MEIRVVEELPWHIDAVRRVNDEAFEQPDESQLIDSLRRENAITLSLVALDNDDVVGHILFTPGCIAGEACRVEAVALGPMAVLPSHQHRGVGSILVREGLQRIRDGAHRIVFVLGHPTYYPRFGFHRANMFGIRWEHNAPTEAFMIMELSPGALKGVKGIAKYHPAFELVV